MHLDENAIGAAIREGSNMANEYLVRSIVTAYLQALSPGSTGETEGWVLVPKEPTLAMSDRAQDLVSLTQKAGWHGAHPMAIYRAMLAAAPCHPSAMLSAAGER